MHNPIFAPSTKDYRIEYPELNEIDEFQELSDSELKFCWWYACKSSPILDRESSDRCIIAAEKAFPKNNRIGDTYKRLRDGNFDPIISAALKRMSSFDEEKRNKAAKMIKQILNNYETLIEVEKEQLEIMEFSEKKAYVEMTKNITDVLPRIIEQTERNFGVSQKAKKNINTDMNLMDSIVSSNS